MNREVRNRDLYNAMLAYTAKLYDVVRNVDPRASGTMRAGGGSWVRVSKSAFQYHPREVNAWATNYHSIGPVLENLAELNVLLEALRADRCARRYLNTWVGTLSHATFVEQSKVTDHILDALLCTPGITTFDTHAFDEHYLKLEASLYREDAAEHALVPLLGLRLDGPPIPLVEGAVIDAFSDEEIGRCIGVGLIPSRFGVDDAFWLMSPQIGIRCSQRQPLVCSDAPPTVEAAEEESRRFSKAVEIAIAALRLLKPGMIAATGVLRYRTEWPLQGGMSIQRLPLASVDPNRAEFALDQQERLQVAEHTQALARVTDPSPLQLSVRRFSEAIARHRPEDELLDLMIAAESLFLGEMGGSKDQGELKYRLSLRAALYVDSDLDFEAVRRHMKRAYDVRSVIAHGGIPDARDLKLPDGTSVDLAGFARETEEILRLALRKAIRTGPRKGSIEDWDGLLARRIRPPDSE